MKLYRVNEITESIEALDGSTVHVEGLLVHEEGLLTFDKGDGTLLAHWPKAEQRASSSYPPFVVIEPDPPVFEFDWKVLEPWIGKRIVVWGTLEYVPDLWAHMDISGPQEPLIKIRARRIDLLKRWKKEHGGNA